MRVLITGGTGFIGSHTTAAVRAAGHEVRLLVRVPARVAPALAAHGLTAQDVEVVVGDVRDETAVRRAMAGCDAVIHSGSVYEYGLPFWRARELLATNVGGTVTVLRAATDLGLDPIVYTSSAWALMQHAPTVLTEATAPGHPPDAYPRSKVAAELIARQLQEAGAPVVIVYPSGVWGPDDPNWGVTTRLAESILRGRLRRAVDGVAPFCDVRDVARLQGAVLKPGRGPRRYLAPSTNLRFFDLVGEVAAAVGRSLPMTALPAGPILGLTAALSALQSVTPVRLPSPYAGVWYLTRNNTFAESRAQREFGIVPRPFRESVRDTVRWMHQTGRLPSALFGKLPAD